MKRGRTVISISDSDAEDQHPADSLIIGKAANRSSNPASPAARKRSRRSAEFEASAAAATPPVKAPKPQQKARTADDDDGRKEDTAAAQQTVLPAPLGVIVVEDAEAKAEAEGRAQLLRASRCDCFLQMELLASADSCWETGCLRPYRCVKLEGSLPSTAPLQP